MISCSATVAVVIQLAAFTAAFPLSPHENRTGYIAFDISAVPVRGAYLKSATKNRLVTDIPEILHSMNALDYITEFEAGTPPQKQTAVVDSGSSYLWMYSTKVAPRPPWYFDGSKSSTFHILNNMFTINYVDSSSAKGNWARDFVHLGKNVSVRADFGLSNKKTPELDQGIMGISPSSPDHLNIVDTLKREGIIDSSTYSLFLSNASSLTGSLLIGAVDHNRYSGQLHTVPFTKPNEFSVDFTVEGSKKMNGILDSGTTLSYLPFGTALRIALKLGARLDLRERAFTRSSPPNPDNTVTYSFSGAEITVPSDELWYKDPKSSSKWILTIQPNLQADGQTILGDSFLRSAYVVYDLDGHQAALAQADYTQTRPDIEPIKSVIPRAIPAPLLKQQHAFQSIFHPFGHE